MIDISTKEKLEQHLENKDKRIAALEKEVSDLGDLVVTGKYAEKPAGIKEYTDDQKKEIGQMFIDLKNGKISQIGDIDKLIKPGDVLGKALVGTPLTTDAVTGSRATGEEYIRDILALAEDKSHLRPFVTRIPMLDRIAHYPKEDSTVEFTYVATDGSAQIESNPTFAATKDLTAYTYATWISLTESVLEDSLFGLADFFRIKIGGALARKFDYELLRGSGSPTTGILNDGSANSTTISGTGFSNVDSEDLFDTVELLTTEMKRDGARWIGHTTAFDYLWRLQDANGRYLFRDVIIAGPSTRLIGYPWMLSGQMPSSSDSAADTGMFVLGNPTHMMWGDRISLEIKLFDQMESTAEFSEVILRARVRMAFENAHPDAFAILKTAAS